MEIVHSGDVAQPSAEAQVAAPRADVGLRTVFRRISRDMDSLYREIASVVGAEVAPSSTARCAAWQDRLLERVGRFAVAYEKMAPYKRTARRLPPPLEVPGHRLRQAGAGTAPRYWARAAGRARAIATAWKPSICSPAS